jgi:hypothetical protein
MGDDDDRLCGLGFMGYWPARKLGAAVIVAEAG